MQEGSLSPHLLQHLLSVDFFYDDHSEQLAIDLKRISDLRGKWHRDKHALLSPAQLLRSE